MDLNLDYTIIPSHTLLTHLHDVGAAQKHFPPLEEGTLPLL